MNKFETPIENNDIKKNRVPQTKQSLSPLQRGILYQSTQTLPTDGSRYLLQTYVHIEGPLKVSIYQKAWQYLMEQHDTLRMGIRYDDHEPLYRKSDFINHGS